MIATKLSGCSLAVPLLKEFNTADAIKPNAQELVDSVLTRTLSRLNTRQTISKIASISAAHCFRNPVMKSNCTCKATLFIGIATISLLSAAPTQPKSEPGPVKLFVRESSVTVLGRTAKVAALTQSNGEQGYDPEKMKGFHVEVVNQLAVPTSIHWHGLVLPNFMDGVPFVTQDPIPPGGSHRYDFPLKQSGSYWMHSHYGLQEQQLR